MIHTVIIWQGPNWSDEHPLEWVEPEERLITPDEWKSVLRTWIAEAVDEEDPSRYLSLVGQFVRLWIADNSP